MGALLVMAGLQAAGGVVNAIEANQERKRQRGIIGRAYDVAAQRQRISQTDVRQQEGGALTERGLAGGGGVMDTGPASGLAPSVTGARDLGGQLTADLGREQSLEVQDLASHRSAALSDVNATANAGEINALGTGVLGAGKTGAAAAMMPDAGQSPIAAAYNVSGGPSDRYPNAWGGIHPTDPWGLGGSSGAGRTTGDFNKYG